MTTKRNPPRTAADRARADLAAAERLRTRTKARVSKADAEHKAAHDADEVAADLVAYYRAQADAVKRYRKWIRSAAGRGAAPAREVVARVALPRRRAARPRQHHHPLTPGRSQHRPHAHDRGRRRYDDG